MSTLLARALTRLTMTACALTVLAALGQPIPSGGERAQTTSVLTTLEQLPLASGLIRSLNAQLTDAPACEADSAEELTDAAADRLARSALRMRWLLTSPSASGRGCGLMGCAG